METVLMNGKEHEVCGGCGAVVGHGCPDSEPCGCDDAEPVYNGMNGVCCK